MRTERNRIMRIDAHAHGIHAEMGPDGRRVPPVMPSWDKNADPAGHVRKMNETGIDKVLQLDVPEVTFLMKEIFGDFVLPCPQIVMDESSPEDVEDLLQRGACGIKFIAPMHPYGDDRYLPLYEVVRNFKALAVFHTGFLVHDAFDPGGFCGRPNWIRITDMRPAELDRINRAFPSLKILMAHFGNPWWEEAWKMIQSNRNIYADFSGGTAYRKSMNLWKEMFAPNGVLDERTVSKLCYASDCSMFSAGSIEHLPFMKFYDDFYDALRLPDSIRRLIDRENILMLTSRS